jgi:hypothetical protein
MSDRVKWLNRWIERNGPFVTHETRRENVEKIYREGLKPHDKGPGSRYTGDLVPRSNHVYLRPYFVTRFEYADTIITADLRKMEPLRMHADEDRIYVPEKARLFGVPLAQTRMFPYPKNWDDLSEDEKTKLRNEWNHVSDESGKEFPHRGAWADYYKLNEPHHFAHSLNHGTMAYEGIIEPESLVSFADAIATMENEFSDTSPWRSYLDRQKRCYGAPNFEPVPYYYPTQLAMCDIMYGWPKGV